MRTAVTNASVIGGIRRSLQRFSSDQRGVSAVEFALILPLMLAMYLGSVEISQGIAIDRKVTLTAHTVADLASQSPNITDAAMNNILSASAAVIQPYDASSLAVTVSSVSIDANGNATVDWSETLNGTARAKGSSVTLPSAIAVPNTSLIFGEVNYNFTPQIGYVISGTLTLADQMFLRPRLSNQVTRSAT